jgi:clumping factor A
MSDDWELAHGLNRFFNDANGDADGDGLSNIQEYNSGSDPQSNDSPSASNGVSALFTVNTAIYSFPVTMDTDGDGMPDWWEQRYGLNGLVNDAEGDADADGVSNLAEFQQGRSPSNNESVTEVASVSAAFALNTQNRPLDSDGDGIPDSWEVAHGLNEQMNDATSDPDGDGRSNLDEYNAGTDPQIDDWRGPSSAVSPLFLADTGGFNRIFRRLVGKGKVGWLAPVTCSGRQLKKRRRRTSGSELVV